MMSKRALPVSVDHSQRLVVHALAELRGEADQRPLRCPARAQQRMNALLDQLLTKDIRSSAARHPRLSMGARGRGAGCANPPYLGGLTTTEIAQALLVREPTMAAAAGAGQRK